MDFNDPFIPPGLKALAREVNGPSNRFYAHSMDDADRRALAGEILVALIGNRNFTYTDTSFESLADHALTLAAIIYPPAPTDEEIEALAAPFKAAENDLHQSFGKIFNEGLTGDPVSPPAAAQEGIEAVSGGPGAVAALSTEDP